MTVEAYVTVHDQDLLLDCETAGRFDALSHTWLFVGPRPVDRVPPDVKVVAARDYHPNVEHLPAFYDFTGWYALVAHQLIDADTVITLQYDMRVARPDLAGTCEAMLASQDGMIAFTAGHRLAHNWMLLIPGFEDAYRRGIARLDVNPLTWPDFNEWPSTQGMAWRTVDLERYMRWFEPLFAEWADEVWAGHLAERTVKAWCVEHGGPERYLPSVISHEACDVHGTGALMRGDLALHADRAATFGR